MANTSPSYYTRAWKKKEIHSFLPLTTKRKIKGKSACNILEAKNILQLYRAKKCTVTNIATQDASKDPSKKSKLELFFPISQTTFLAVCFRLVWPSPYLFIGSKNQQQKIRTQVLCWLMWAREIFSMPKTKVSMGSEQKKSTCWIPFRDSAQSDIDLTKKWSCKWGLVQI